MSNTWFQFKQFKIEQASCAMKVCTDACIFGAWYASRIQHAKAMLDIGSGTGLLMMMLAQQNGVVVHGIEIEDGCYSQLQENIAGNKWADRMVAFRGDVRGYAFPLVYDFVISNPPFYEKDLGSSDAGRQLAMHSSALNLDQLAAAIAGNLSPGGCAGVLLPYHRAGDFDKAAAVFGLYAVDRLLVRHTEKHQWFRVITTYAGIEPGTLSLASSPVLSEPPGEYIDQASYRDNSGKPPGIYKGIDSQVKAPATWMLTIRNADGSYTSQFSSLMEPYYL
jgi:tRNA1Val (adenine37-N6)-methyltransferase